MFVKMKRFSLQSQLNRKEVKNILKQNWEGEAEVWSIWTGKKKKGIPITVVKIFKNCKEKKMFEQEKKKSYYISKDI